MNVDKVLELKAAMETSVARVLEEIGANPHEVQVRVVCVLDNGDPCFWDVVVP